MRLESMKDVAIQRDDEETERRQLEAVAPFLLGALVAPPPTPAPVPELDVKALASPSAEPWRAGDGARGPDRSEQAPLRTSLESGEGDHVGQSGNENKMVMRVDAGELGSIGVVVERSAQGIRLLLAVENAAAASVADLERLSLWNSLQASGLKIAGISIVQSSDPGIVLAGDATAMRSIKSAGIARTDEESGPAQTRGTRRGWRRLDTAG